LEDPEESGRGIIKKNKDKYSLFPEMRGLTFEKPKKAFIIRMLCQVFNHFTDLPDNNELFTLKLSFQERRCL
jgi:hypothetical protein